MGEQSPAAHSADSPRKLCAVRDFGRLRGITSGLRSAFQRAALRKIAGTQDARIVDRSKTTAIGLEPASQRKDVLPFWITVQFAVGRRLHRTKTRDSRRSIFFWRP